MNLLWMDVPETNQAFGGAVALYESLGFQRISPFPPYDAMPEASGSLCMAKDLER